jgi:hypothetical protein
MTTIFSTRFIGGYITQAAPLYYTVPANSTVSLKYATIAITSGNSTSSGVLVTGTLYLIIWPAIALNAYSTWSGSVVCNAGDQLEFFVNGATAAVTLSGFLFQN